MKYLLSLLIILGGCLTALADSEHTTVTTVPFEFVVGNQTLPAGTYTISQVSMGGKIVLRVRNNDGKGSLFIIPVVTDPFVNRPGTRMVFDHTATKYFLTNIVSDDRSFIFARHRSAGVPDPASTVVTSPGQ